MKKYLVTTVLFVCLALFLGTCGSALSVERPSAVGTVESLSVTVLAYFPTTTDQAGKIVERLIAGKPTRCRHLIMYTRAQDKKGNAYVVYIGAGTMLKDDHVLTVAHLCYADDEGLTNVNPQMWVLPKGSDHPIKATIIAKTKENVNVLGPDYAVLKLSEKIKKPGARIASSPASVGELLYFSGSVKGAAFFLRAGRSTALQQFLTRDENDALRLVFLFDAPMLTVYPAGPGDSGGGIFNEAGELVGVMFAGLQIAQEMYVFSNSLDSLRAFLKANNLESLVK